MDEVSRKRPQPGDSRSRASRSIISSKRPLSDDSTQPAVTNNGGPRELSSDSAVNARKASSQTASEDDDDYTSSSGSFLSSSDDDGDDDDQNETPGGNETVNRSLEHITSLSHIRKPHIRRLDKQPDLLSKLSEFLPQMKSANEDLQREIAEGRATEMQLDGEDDDNGDGQYIEMNLGLGVLEERRSNDAQSSSNGEASESGNHGLSEEANVLDRLMGKEKSSSEKPSIQELGH